MNEMRFNHLLNLDWLKARFAARNLWLALVVTVATSLVFVAASLAAGVTQLASVNRDGTNGGNSSSFEPALSADGRFVAFYSDASDLVSNDTNYHNDIFVRDLQNGTTTLVSVNRDGTNGGNASTYNSVLSADGRFVAFISGASDFVDNDTNYADDVFVRDLQNGTTTLASVNLDGTNSGNYDSYSPVLSADGRFVAFFSSASDLVDNDTNNVDDVFVRDLQNGTTILVSVNRDGTHSGNSSSVYPALSAEGRFVAFYSLASDLVSNDTNNKLDVFVRDLNQPPIVDAGGPYEVQEGASVSLTASGDDPEGGPLAYAWDLDNDGSFEAPGQSVTFSAARLDGPGNLTIAVQVTDSWGLTAMDQATIDIVNVAPTASFANTSGVLIAGQSAWLAFSDPLDPGAADTAAGFQYFYDCTSDGGFEPGDPAAPAYACDYPDSGVFIATGRIQDKDGGYTDYSVEVTVLTPQQGVEGLIESVAELVGGDILNPGQGNALMAKLEAAILQLDLGNYHVAINQLEAFIHQIEGMIGSGVLSPVDGQPLIDAAREIIAVLSNRSSLQ